MRLPQKHERDLEKKKNSVDSRHAGQHNASPLWKRSVFFCFQTDGKVDPYFVIDMILIAIMILELACHLYHQLI